MFYQPPLPADLLRLADELGFKRSQMAELAGVSTARQWAKYTWTEKTPANDRRDMGFHMLFLVAARIELAHGHIKNVEQVYARMRSIGAKVDPDSDGEQRP